MQLDRYIVFLKTSKITILRRLQWKRKKHKNNETKKKMHFQYAVLGLLDEFMVSYKSVTIYEYISSINMESFLNKAKLQ